MWIFLLIILFLFAIFFGLCLKYKNPYTLTFIFGKKGSGKTCMMVREIIKHKKKGWLVYTDIPVNIPDVRLINPKDLGDFVPEPHSVLVLDEVGISFNNRNYKTFTDSQLAFWKLMRHYHCKCIMASQSWDADKKLRDLTDKMILQTNIGNVISVSRPIKRSITLTEPTSEAESRIADKLSFCRLWNWKFYYMPKYFKYFDSFDKKEDIPTIRYTLTQIKSLTNNNVFSALEESSRSEQ